MMTVIVHTDRLVTVTSVEGSNIITFVNKKHTITGAR